MKPRPHDAATKNRLAAKRQDPPNARFWENINGGWVKLTVTPDGCLEHYSGGPCDEGYSHTWMSWEQEDGALIHKVWNDSRDCDGRHSSGGEYHAEMNELRYVKAYHQSNYCYELEPRDPSGNWIMRPHWTHGERTHRDYAAEAMGY